MTAEEARRLSSSPRYRSWDEQRAIEQITRAAQRGERSVSVGMGSLSSAVTALRAAGFEVEPVTEALGSYQIYEIEW